MAEQLPGNSTENAKRSNLPIVALIPNDGWLDNEASAAEEAGLPVYRFPILGRDDVELGPLDPEPSSDLPALVIYRGFMLTGEKYTLLYRDLQSRYSWTLITTPEQYERAHYYPNVYPYFHKLLSAQELPRAVWTECETGGNTVITRDNFLQAAKIVGSWGCQSCVVKDYVKSAKDTIDGGKRFLEAPADDPTTLSELAVELIAERGSRFNRGVVFKELVPLKKYRDAWRRERLTNEWRCFFGCGHLLGMHRNSCQPKKAPEPPDTLVKAVSAAAKAIGSPYMTVDLAECANQDGHWIVLEAGDGGVSGRATDQDIADHWRALSECFKPLSTDDGNR